eukprot:8036144-Alexandrium_andersonii.AAC.1
MSASLVGSEMCIRDRLWTGVPYVGGAPFGGHPKQCRLTARIADAKWSSPCLLYTSDAADDM